MIGGTDFIIHGPVRPEAVDLVWRLMRNVWPDGYVTAADSDERAPLSSKHPMWTLPSELFVYQDDDVYLHFIFGADDITVVYEPQDLGTRRLVVEIAKALRFNNMVGN